MSLTIKGLVVLALGYIAQAVGWQGETFTEMQVESVINGAAVVMQIGGLLVAYIGRVRKGDIDLLGRRTAPFPTIDTGPDS